MTTATINDLQEAERIVAASGTPTPAIGVPRGTSPHFRLINAIAEALAARSNREHEVLTRLRKELDVPSVDHDMAVTLTIQLIDDRLAELAGGPTGENR